ncbi:MAG: N-acetylmuramoyl-L-alanine amidase, partial [Puniceicoccales bacterium]|nr:N-acetylmuramoyl-L-alanine amidase [Puniceicoccales bacterium]
MPLFPRPAKRAAAANSRWRAVAVAFFLAPLLSACTDADAANENAPPATDDAKPSSEVTVAAAATPAPAPRAAPAPAPRPAPAFVSAPRPVAPAHRPAPVAAAPAPSAALSQRVSLNSTFAQWGFTRDPKAPAGTAIWRKPAINVKVEFRRDKAEVVLNGTHVWLGAPVSEIGNTYSISRADYDNTLLPVLAPVSALGKQAPKRVRHVFLDPGHGGDDIGRISPGTAPLPNEKSLNLDVAFRVKYILERRGVKVTLSRTRDVKMELGDRPALAKKVGADIFVSIHFNSQGETGNNVSGIETYVLAPQGQYSTNVAKGSITRTTLNSSDPGHANNVRNTILGYQLQAALASKIGSGDRGLRRGRLAVLRRATCPAVLIECGFLTNPAEAARIKLPAHREKIAQAIADGIFRYQKLMDSHAAAAGQRPP